MNRKTLFDAGEVRDAVDSITAKIAGDIEENHIGDIALIGIQLRGVPLARRIAGKLSEKLNIVVQTGSLDISMYRDDIGKRKKLTDIHETDIPFDIDDKSIILVDDILHTGRTIRAALDAVTDYGRPNLIKLAVFMDRGGHEFPIAADYAGRTLDLRGESGFVTLRLAEIDGEDAAYLAAENPHAGG